MRQHPTYALGLIAYIRMRQRVDMKHPTKQSIVPALHHRAKLSEIAAKIDAHLQRFESDEQINVAKHGTLKPYYRAGAYATYQKVRVAYVSFQATHMLKKTEAEAYLAWLDAGNVGKHWTALGLLR